MSTRPSFDVKRHFTELSEKETDAVIGTVADLVVNYLKKRRGFAQPAPADATATRNEEAEAQEVRA